MDRDLLSEVFGRRVWPRALTPALLRGYRRSAAHGASYPVVLRERGASVKGIFVSGVSVAERARLSAYEGDGYELAHAVAELPGKTPKSVFLFKPKPAVPAPTSRPWSLASWRLHHKASEIKVLAAEPPRAGRNSPSAASLRLAPSPAVQERG